MQHYLYRERHQGCRWPAIVCGPCNHRGYWLRCSDIMVDGAKPATRQYVFKCVVDGWRDNYSSLVASLRQSPLLAAVNRLGGALWVSRGWKRWKRHGSPSHKGPHKYVILQHQVVRALKSLSSDESGSRGYSGVMRISIYLGFFLQQVGITNAFCMQCRRLYEAARWPIWVPVSLGTEHQMVIKRPRRFQAGCATQQGLLEARLGGCGT